MKILMFSTDPSILRHGSPAYERMREYARALGELHIVLPGNGEETKEDGNLFIHPARGDGILGRLHCYGIAKKILLQSRFDVITVQGPDEVGLTGYLLAKKFGLPFQLQIHTDIMSPWYRRAGIKERIRYHIAGFLIPRAGCIRAVSERIKKSIIEFGIPHPNLPPSYEGGRSTYGSLPLLKEGGGRGWGITVLPVYTDLSKFLNAKANPEIDKRFKNYSFKMIAVGRFIDKEKNFSMLIDMMREFVKVCPGALLVLVGDGPDRVNYESRIMNHGLQKDVIIEGWRDDLASFYKSFDLFLLPSNYEGWGRAVIEAMAAGLPVVMTDVGLAGEVVKDGVNGRVVPVGDIRAMREAVKELYDNKEMRIGFVHRGQEQIQKMAQMHQEDYLFDYKKSFELCKLAAG